MARLDRPTRDPHQAIVLDIVDGLQVNLADHGNEEEGHCAHRACRIDIAAKVEAACTALDNHDLVFLHVKGADTCAHDLDPEGKKASGCLYHL